MIRIALRSLRGALRRFARQDRGLAAVELAFIAPIMVTAFLGSAELSNAMAADRKVSEAASSVADLVAQATIVTNADMTNILNCGNAIMSPLSTSTMGIRVSSVVADNNNIGRVAWSDAKNMSTRANNSIVSVPAGVLTPGASVIYTEVQYTFTSPFGEFLIGGVVLRDTFMLRPRRSLTISRVAS